MSVCGLFKFRKVNADFVPCDRCVKEVVFVNKAERINAVNARGHVDISFVVGSKRNRFRISRISRLRGVCGIERYEFRNAAAVFVDNVVIAFFRYSDFAFFEFGRVGEYRHVIARKHVCAVCVNNIFVDDVLTVEKTFQSKFDRHFFCDAAVLFKGDCRAEAQSDVFAVGKFKRSAVCDFVCALEHRVDKCVHRGACLVAAGSATAGSATAARSAALVSAAVSFIFAGSQNADAQNENANYCEYSQKILVFHFWSPFEI